MAPNDEDADTEVPATPPSRSRPAALVVMAGVIGLLIVALVVVLVRDGDDDQEVSTTTESSTSSTVATTISTVPPTSPNSATSTAPNTTTAEPAGNEDGRFPGDVTRAYLAADGTPHLEIDYVLFYSGEEAHEQAEARGTEAPNDIFIVNDNPRLRDFPIAPATTVSIVCFGDEPGCASSDTGGGLSSRTLTVTDWIAEGHTGEGGDLFGRASNLFYVTVAGGQVVDIDEQYVP